MLFKILNFEPLITFKVYMRTIRSSCEDELLFLSKLKKILFEMILLLHQHYKCNQSSLQKNIFRMKCIFSKLDFAAFNAAKISRHY